MPRPRIEVEITPGVQRRGAPTATGPAFMATAAGNGPTDPVELTSKAEAEALFGAIPFAQWVGDALTEGAPKVTAVRAAGALAELTTGEWDAALSLINRNYGPGQVLIPGVATPAAHSALLAHAASTGRTVLLDGDEDPTSAELLGLAATARTAAGAERAGLVASWVRAAGTGGVARTVPGSVVAAGLAGRNDAIAGHANNAPAWDQGRGAGTSRIALRGKAETGLTATFTDSEWDDLHDAGVSLIVPTPDGPQLQGWRSLSADNRFHQLSAGRLAMQVQAETSVLMAQFQGRNINTALYREIENALRGYLLRLYDLEALFGDTADDAYDVAVESVNTPQMAADRFVRSEIDMVTAQHGEVLSLGVTTYLPGERAA